MKIQFGLNNTVEKPAADYGTVADVKEDERVMSFLGVDPDASEVSVNGMVVDDDYSPAESDTLSFRTKANSKG